MNWKRVGAKIRMMEDNILPALTAKELEEMLKSLSPEEQKTYKRKFRKIWRKLTKKDPQLLSLFVGKEGGPPTKSNMRNRCVFVVLSYIKSTPK